MSNQSAPTQSLQPKPRHMGRINKVGLQTLYEKEVRRFTSIYTQTIAAPVITTLLFFMVFSLALGGAMRMVGDIPYLEFLVPGLVMMSMAQNAFANTSSSILIAKMQNNIVDVLMPPLSPLELTIGYVAAGITRGLMVGAATGLVLSLLAGASVAHPLLLAAFAVQGSMLLSSLGVITGIWSDKWDHMNAVTNFIITPLTFLSGTFYSIKRLPEVWQVAAHFDPFFYMIDGFRYGFIGQADSPVWLGMAVLSVINIALALACYWCFKTGYRLKT